MKSKKLENGVVDVWTPEEVDKKQREGGVTLIDVRTPQEFAFERIEGALLFPMQSFDPKHLPCQDSKPIVLHCGSGVRSEKIANLCLGGGCASIAHMEGGLSGWKEAGLTFIGTDVQSGAPAKKADGESQDG